MEKNAQNFGKKILLRLSEPFPALLLVNFTGALGFSVVLPVLVFLVHKWGGNALIYGLVGATYSVFQFIGSPILGRWSDRYGRKRILLLSQLGTVLSWLLVLIAFYIPSNTILNVDSSLFGKFSLTLPLIFLFLSRAGDGITGANSSVANAYVADVTPEDERDERFGKMGVSSNMGYIFGPALAGLLGGTILGFELPILATMAIATLTMILTLIGLPKVKHSAAGLDPDDSNPHKVMGMEHSPSILPETPSKMSNTELIRLPGIFVFLTTYFLVMLAFNFFYVAFPVQAATEMKWTVKHTGAFFTVMSIFMVIVQGAVLPRLSKVWSDKRLVCVGSAFLALGFLAFTPASNWITFVGAALIALGNGLMWPPLVALLSKASGQHQGAVQGLTGSVSATASVLGMILGGLMYGFLKDWLFVLSAILISIIVVLSVKFPPEKQKSEPNKAPVPDQKKVENA
jgi:DHA1 family tetracycline resistance protein-like MFS transporter